jgi:hypothetical protein
MDSIDEKIAYESRRLTLLESNLRQRFANLEAVLGTYDNIATQLESHNFKPVQFIKETPCTSRQRLHAHPVTTTTPGHLVVLLYDGAITFLEQAKSESKKKTTPRKVFLSLKRSTSLPSWTGPSTRKRAENSPKICTSCTCIAIAVFCKPI